MEKYLIEGSHRLHGEVRVNGAKNAALPIIAAALLTPEECVFDNVPWIEDIRSLAEILRQLGCQVELDIELHRMRICARPAVTALLCIVCEVVWREAFHAGHKAMAAPEAAVRTTV